VVFFVCFWAVLRSVGMAVVDGAIRWRARGAWRHCLRWARDPPQGVGDGGDAKMWTLTQRVGNPSFLSLPVSFSASLWVPLNREGGNTPLMEARCRVFGDGRVDFEGGQLRSGEQAVSSRLLWCKSGAREGCFWSLFAIDAAVTACSFSASLFCVVLFVVLCRAVVFFSSTLCACRADAGALFAFGCSFFLL